MWVYKITNLINQKCYVGITNNIYKRWIQHKSYKDKKGNKPLYLAFKKYGISNFKFEIIEEGITDIKVLGNRERYYIKQYKSHVTQNGYNVTWGGEKCQFDANPRTKLTVEDVKNIRKIYAECKIGTTQCWKFYKDKISSSAFEKIWEGQTWKGISPEVYTEENKKLHIKIMGKNISGENNKNALFSNFEVLEIRKYYVNHSLTETFKKFGKQGQTKQSFRGVIDRSYSNIPIYRKIKKCWVLNGKVINIKDYNPESTISVSGE